MKNKRFGLILGLVVIVSLVGIGIAFSEDARSPSKDTATPGFFEKLFRMGKADKTENVGNKIPEGVSTTPMTGLNELPLYLANLGKGSSVIVMFSPIKGIKISIPRTSIKYPEWEVPASKKGEMVGIVPYALADVVIEEIIDLSILDNATKDVIAKHSFDKGPKIVAVPEIDLPVHDCEFGEVFGYTLEGDVECNCKQGMNFVGKKVNDKPLQYQCLCSSGYFWSADDYACVKKGPGNCPGGETWLVSQQKCAVPPSDCVDIDNQSTWKGKLAKIKYGQAIGLPQFVGEGKKADQDYYSVLKDITLCPKKYKSAALLIPSAVGVFDKKAYDACMKDAPPSIGSPETLCKIVATSEDYAPSTKVDCFGATLEGPGLYPNLYSSGSKEGGDWLTAPLSSASGEILKAIMVEGNALIQNCNITGYNQGIVSDAGNVKIMGNKIANVFDGVKCEGNVFPGLIRNEIYAEKKGVVYKKSLFGSAVFEKPKTFAGILTENEICSVKGGVDIFNIGDAQFCGALAATDNICCGAFAATDNICDDAQGCTAKFCQSKCK